MLIRKLKRGEAQIVVRPTLQSEVWRMSAFHLIYILAIAIIPDRKSASSRVERCYGQCQNGRWQIVTGRLTVMDLFVRAPFMAVTE